MANILVLLTNHPVLGTTDEPNGTYIPELTHALAVLIDAGHEYTLASIHGGEAPFYGTDPEDQVTQRLLANTAFMDALNNTQKLETLDASAFDGVFYPGGFGLLSDLAEHPNAAALSAEVYEKGGILAAVCHGPAGLLPITLSNGEPLLAQIHVTGFTREEEIDFGTIDKIPFLLEEALARNAKQYSKVKPWQSLVIADERVITGQNPASAHAVGEAMVKHLQ